MMQQQSVEQTNLREDLWLSFGSTQESDKVLGWEFQPRFIA